MWGIPEDRLFEAGVDRGVLYLSDGSAVPWNGLTSVKDAPTIDSDEIDYFDGQKFIRRQSSEGFAATIEALTYPSEFEGYDGVDGVMTQQRRKFFGFSYRTHIGNAVTGELGYKIHLVYNALAQPSDKTYSSIGESVDVSALSWDITTLPIAIPGIKPSSHLVIDSTIALPRTMQALEDALYGTDDVDGTLPSPLDVLEIFESNATLRIIDNGDGTWTAETDADDIITMLDDTTFQISWPSAVYIDTDTYQISSL